MKLKFGYPAGHVRCGLVKAFYPLAVDVAKRALDTSALVFDVTRVSEAAD